MYFLSKMGIFQPAMLVYQAGYQSREVLKLSKSQRAEIASVRIGSGGVPECLWSFFIDDPFQKEKPWHNSKFHVAKGVLFYVHKTFQEG